MHTLQSRFRPSTARRATALLAAGATAAALAAAPGAATAAGLAGSSAATAQRATAAPVVVAHLGKRIRLSADRVHAGRVTFRAVARHGDHTLQLARLHNGYTLQEAGQDLSKAFGGDVAAIRRVDDNISFLGGAEARRRDPGRFSVTLRRGDYLALDQANNAVTDLHVVGKPIRHRAPHASSAIGMFSYGFGAHHRIPHRGWTRLFNQSDQPHFVVFLHVKRSTTARMVHKYFSSMGESQPSFGLPGGTSTGVISAGKQQLFHYNLPRGKWVIACFWPDDDTGMPHAFMGMWKLLVLK